MAKLVKEQRNLIERKLQQVKSRKGTEGGKKPIDYGITREGFYRIIQRASQPTK